MEKYTAHIALIRSAKDRPKEFLPNPPEMPPILDRVTCEMVLVSMGYRVSEINEMSEFDVRARSIAVPLVKTLYPSLFG